MTGIYIVQHGICSVYPGTEFEKGRQADLRVAKKVFFCWAGSQTKSGQHNICALELQEAKKTVHFRAQEWNARSLSLHIDKNYLLLPQFLDLITCLEFTWKEWLEVAFGLCTLADTIWEPFSFWGLVTRQLIFTFQPGSHFHSPFKGQKVVQTVPSIITLVDPTEKM